MISINYYYNILRKIFGLKYWSLSKYIKVKVKKASAFMKNFEDSATKYAKQNGYDGIICGHIHEPTIKKLNDIEYLNCGCWTDLTNCSAIVEKYDGTIESIKWKVGNEILY